MKTNYINKIGLAVVIILLLSDCTSTPQQKNTVDNTTAQAKDIHGNSLSKDPAHYAISASGVGGKAGSVIENYMSTQALRLQRDLTWIAQVAPIGEGIKMTINSAILFKSNQINIAKDPQKQLSKMAATLAHYDQTEILIAGHTDNTGEIDANQLLSEKRAQAVADFLITKGIDKNRLVVKGFGAETPIASNTNKDGRRQNNRVEIVVVANEKLKQTAKSAKTEPINSTQ